MVDAQIWDYVEDYMTGDISKEAFWELVNRNKNKAYCGLGRERCDRRGHALFLRPRVDSAVIGSDSRFFPCSHLYDIIRIKKHDTGTQQLVHNHTMFVRLSVQ